jgi:hypothetical protein
MTLQSHTNCKPSTSNGNGTARPVERGRSVAHRKDSKQQRAAKAAAVYAGQVTYWPTRRELSLLYRVSGGMIDRARALSIEKRQAVAEGRAKFPRLNNGQSQLAPSKPPSAGNGKLNDTALFTIVRNAGIEPVLAIASALEQAAHH